jgi:hypothetical protein
VSGIHWATQRACKGLKIGKEKPPEGGLISGYLLIFFLTEFEGLGQWRHIASFKRFQPLFHTYCRLHHK